MYINTTTTTAAAASSIGIHPSIDPSIHPSIITPPISSILFFVVRIGYDIARRLGLDGAKVVVSSRRQKNVSKAVEQLQSEKIDAHGIVCHVGYKEHREKLLAEVGVTDVTTMWYRTWYIGALSFSIFAATPVKIWENGCRSYWNLAAILHWIMQMIVDNGF